VDDDLPSDQGRAQVSLAMRGLKPLEEAISKLGFDVSKTHS
jgi:hypothetical protein